MGHTAIWTGSELVRAWVGSAPLGEGKLSTYPAILQPGQVPGFISSVLLSLFSRNWMDPIALFSDLPPMIQVLMLSSGWACVYTHVYVMP